MSGSYLTWWSITVWHHETSVEFLRAMKEGCIRYSVIVFYYQSIIYDWRTQFRFGIASVVDAILAGHFVGRSVRLLCMYYHPSILIYRDRDKMAATFQMTCPSAFSWMKMCECWLNAHRKLFRGIQWHHPWQNRAWAFAIKFSSNIVFHQLTSIL